MKGEKAADPRPRKKGIMKRLLSLFIVLVIVAAACTAAALAVNGYIYIKTGDRIVTSEGAAEGEYDCILVLGCGIIGSDRPSPMLKDRLDRSLELYFAGVADKIIMSGDHGRVYYDEVNVMKNYVVQAGVPSSDVFMDHAGFSTYESIYRARDVFMVKSAVIVTQTYHLYRALYVARRLGVDAVGVSADTQEYAGRQYRLAREFLARVKDFMMCVFKPEPTFLGDVVPVWGDGDATND
ncbi:MAG: DUF218 domain-containing protein [Clostridiales bacterium]|jgi:vancomycin permeability regulator SanA|nr:DUF218 domain-containing protein [Clostridiales bacterium]